MAMHGSGVAMCGSSANVRQCSVNVWWWRWCGWQYVVVVAMCGSSVNVW